MVILFILNFRFILFSQKKSVMNWYFPNNVLIIRELENKKENIDEMEMKEINKPTITISLS